MFNCPNCNFKSNKVDVQTTEIGNVKWFNPKFNKDGTLKGLGNKWEYLGGETWEGRGHLVLCKKCEEVIKEIE